MKVDLSKTEIEALRSILGKVDAAPARRSSRAPSEPKVNPKTWTNTLVDAASGAINPIVTPDSWGRIGKAIKSYSLDDARVMGEWLRDGGCSWMREPPTVLLIVSKLREWLPKAQHHLAKQIDGAGDDEEKTLWG